MMKYAPKTGLHQQRGSVAEVEDVLEVRHEDVVQRCDEADAEVERDHQGQGHGYGKRAVPLSEERCFPCGADAMRPVSGCV